MSYPIYRIRRDKVDPQRLFTHQRDERPCVVTLKRKRPANSYRYAGSMHFIGGKVVAAFVKNTDARRLIGIPVAVFER